MSAPTLPRITVREIGPLRDATGFCVGVRFVALDEAGARICDVRASAANPHLVAFAAGATSFRHHADYRARFPGLGYTLVIPGWGERHFSAEGGAGRAP